MLICSSILVVVLIHFYTKMSKVILFWIAFVLTRPFGGTFGDLLTKPIEKGGFDLGTIGSSSVLFSILILLVIYAIFIERRKTHRVDKND